MSDKELDKLSANVAKEQASRKKSKLKEARAAAEAAAKKLGFSLTELVSQQKAKPAAKRAPAKAKYANPADPKQTWTGRGRQPVWFKDAVAKGADPKSMEI
ncbi:H-NS histone family protein [Ovoidimarina sediminis]|uniref:H-NS histone family protein n=1 Tax=Ovoidimarina sediminis TaxID=3079856 RepID=UPI00292E2EB7|nr:H-NS histone family protein [Rhodophyticola sp. MJ-SS7]